MKTKEEILIEVWDAQNMDLQMCITLNPQVAFIKEAMEIYAQMKVNELNKSDVIKSVCQYAGCYEYATCKEFCGIHCNCRA